MQGCIIIVIWLCICQAQPIYHFDAKLTPSHMSWSDVIVDRDCDVLGTGIPANVSVSDIQVNIQGIQEESEVWIGSIVIYTPWIKIEPRHKRVPIEIIDSKTIKRCFNQCKISFVIGQSSSCKCGDHRSNTLSKFLDYVDILQVSDGIMIYHRGVETVYKPVDVSTDSSIGNCKTVWLSDGNISLRTTPCSSCISGRLVRDRNYRVINDWLFFDDARDVPERRNMTCVGVFRFQTFQWYNKNQPQNDPLHCLSAVVTNGRLSPRVRHCHTKLKAMCVVGITSQKPENDIAVTTFLVALIVGAISEGVLAIAMVIVFVVCMTRIRKMSNRFQKQQHPSCQNQQYSSLDHADRSPPPPAYDVLGSPEHYIPLNQADRSPPSVYDVVSNQDHVYDEPGQNRTG